MGTLYVNRINPTTGSIVTVDGHVRVTGDLEVTGTLNANVEDFIVNADSTVLGNTNSDTTTVTSQLTASEGMLVKDDKKIFFGDHKDASIEYNENGNNKLVISGSAIGIEITGAITQTKGTVTLGTDLNVGDDLSLVSDSSVFSMGIGGDFTITHDGQLGATIAGTELHIDGGANINLSASNNVRVENDLRLTSDASIFSMGAGNDFTITHDGQLGATIAGTELHIDGGANINLSASNNVRVENDLRLTSDASILSMGAGNDFTITHDGQLGATIAGTELHIDGGANINLSASNDVRVENDLRLTSDASIFSMGAGNDFTITHDGQLGATIAGTELHIDGGANINLSASNNVRVENDLRLTSDASILSMGAGNDFTITHNGQAGATIAGTELHIDGGANVHLSASNNVTVENDLRLTSDSAILSFGDGNDITFTHDGGTGMDIVSAGTLDIGSTGGSMTVGSALTDGQTLKLGKNGAVETIIAPHGTAGSELYSVTNTAGTAATAIALTSTAGGITLSSAATTAQDAVTLSATQTTKNALTITANALTDGDGIALSTTSSDTASRALIKLTNDNASATGTSMIELDQDSTGDLITANYGANGSAVGLKVKEVAGNVATDATVTDFASFFPANCVPIAIAFRVTTAITNNGYISAVGYELGGGADVDFFTVLTDGVLEQVNDTAVIPFNPTATSIYFASAMNLRLTHNAQPSAGAVRIALYYYQITPPTS
tara:strand:- start:1011 stop:3197 length:2187 start_codon:yes stop_codon:yes gene_type:complete